MTELNGGFRVYPNRVTNPIYFRSQDYSTKQATIKSGQVLKSLTFLESDANGKLIAHTGMVEKALVTFAAITSGQTLILGGLTFTAGSSGCSIADLVTAFSGLTAGIGYAAANTLSPVGGGSFTSGTLGTYNTFKSSTANSVVFYGSTPNADVTNIADTGTATDPTITITAFPNPKKPIAGVLLYDVDATSADVVAPVYKEASFMASALVWSVNPLTDYILAADGTKVYCTDYYTGATTNNLKKKLVEGTEFDELGIFNAGETY